MKTVASAIAAPLIAASCVGSAIDKVETAIDRQRTETTATIVKLSDTWQGESKAWRGEVAAVREGFLGEVAAPANLSHGGTASSSGGGSDPDRAMLWAGVAGAAFTMLKTGARLWKDRKTGAPAS